MSHQGCVEKARQLWIAAGKVFSQYGLPWEAAETLITCGTLLQRQGKTKEGVANLNAAIQIYRHLELGARWEARAQKLSGSAVSSPTHSDSFFAPQGTADTLVPAVPAPTGIYSLATTQDVALLGTLIHDAIAHLMNAIDKAAKMRVPIERIAAATERISRISTPVERLARALEQASRNSAPRLLHAETQRTWASHSRRQKLNRSHDPGRPL